MDFSLRDRYTVDDLVALMELLRSEDGCPWDREQTHSSIRKNVIEEAYEVADAIDKGDPISLCEELGDLLLQVVFQSQMSREEGTFTFDDVADGICKKLVLRHPHIFSDVNADGSQEVLNIWEEVKKKEKGQETATETLRAVPSSFPALMRSQKVQSRAARTGFKYPDTSMVWETLRSEIEELDMAVKEGNTDSCTEELGDVLFSVVQLSRMLDIDAEQALQLSCDKFIGRFSVLEKLAQDKHISLGNAAVPQLLDLWREAKEKASK